MVEKTWPALKSCKYQRYEANDRLSQLPDDILFLILSLLTMKEAARTSVLSRKWNYLWRCFPILIFEELSVMRKTSIAKKLTFKKRRRFCRWVNRVLESHLGQTIDELRVTFDLDDSCQYDVNKLVAFALAKQVKKLELDLTPQRPGSSPPKWRRSHNLAVSKSCLRSICLKDVNVTSKAIECLLLSCSVLENLCVVSSPSLKHVRAFGSPLQLKHLEISHCFRLKTIDILAPKLLTFTHLGDPIQQLHITSAFLLSEVSLGCKFNDGDIVAYAFDYFSKYFSQLEYLSLQIRLWIGPRCSYAKINSGIINPPFMTNLKYLKLNVYGISEQSLLGWADMIEASPVLQRLTVEFSGVMGFRKTITIRKGRPLESLKTLEFCGHLGLPICLEFMTYVVENSIILDNVIVQFRPLRGRASKYASEEDHVANLERIIPQGVNLTLKPVTEYWGSI